MKIPIRHSGTPVIRFRDHWQKAAFTVLLVLFVFLMDQAVAPAWTFNRLSNEAVRSGRDDTARPAPAADPAISALLREKARKQALLEMSKRDSVNLLVDLADSEVCLSVKGVPLYRVPVIRYSVDRLLEKIPEQVYLQLFSGPLAITSAEASIPKEPIIIHLAPSGNVRENDSVANGQMPASDNVTPVAVPPADEPGTPVFVWIELENGICLSFVQEDPCPFKQAWVRWRFMNKIRVRTTARTLGRFFTLKKPDYRPVIRLSLPKADLLTIYRAMPGKPYVVLSFP